MWYMMAVVQLFLDEALLPTGSERKVLCCCLFSLFIWWLVRYALSRDILTSKTRTSASLARGV
jgi:hypothetical protein